MSPEEEFQAKEAYRVLSDYVVDEESDMSVMRGFVSDSLGRTSMESSPVHPPPRFVLPPPPPTPISGPIELNLSVREGVDRFFG